jgi:hypothetical protein
MPLSKNMNIRVDGDIRAGLGEILQRAGPDVKMADVVRRAMRELIARELGPGWKPPGPAGSQ